MEEVTRL